MNAAEVDREQRFRELFVLGLSGNGRAYGEFLTEISPHLRGFFRRRLGALGDDAEDLVQETLIAVHVQRHTYDPDQPLTPWIHALARYKMIDFLRRHGKRAMATETLDAADQVIGALDDQAGQARIDVAKLLASLPERQRASIVCMKIEGLSVLETAERTGQSPSAVKVNVHRGLKALAALIRNER